MNAGILASDAIQTPLGRQPRQRRGERTLSKVRPEKTGRLFALVGVTVLVFHDLLLFAGLGAVAMILAV